jgi:hypothetical protein
MSADELEIALIRREREMRGQCPCCEQPKELVKHWVAPDRSSDVWRMLNERGIDPATGHANDCQER